MDFDVARARRDTPGCDEVVHFNNAGSSLMPEVVYETVKRHLDSEYRMGGYEAADANSEALRNVYHEVAGLLGADPQEIALIENATRAWDMAFYSFRFLPGDRVLTSISEYASNYIAFLQASKRYGLEVVAVPNDPTGALSVDALERLVDDRVKLIAVTHVPTNGGLVNPAEAIGAVARRAGIPFLLDACQSVGQLAVNVDAIGCDMLSATGRKYLRGPRGTGFLYVRKDLLERLEPPFLDLRAAEWTAPGAYRVSSDARKFETWESNVAANLGLGAAVRYVREWGIERIQNRVTALAEQLREGLGEVPGAAVRDLGTRRCGIVSLTCEGLDAQEIVNSMRRRHINVSKAVLPHTLLDMTSRGLESMVRASVHYYNTPDEIQAFCRELADMKRQAG